MVSRRLAVGIATNNECASLAFVSPHVRMPHTADRAIVCSSLREFLGRFSRSLTRWPLNAQEADPELHHSTGRDQPAARNRSGDMDAIYQHLNTGKGLALATRS